MQALREIADENDIMLIYDEVQTGIGVTGKMWAHQHFSTGGCETGVVVQMVYQLSLISFHLVKKLRFVVLLQALV